MDINSSRVRIGEILQDNEYLRDDDNKLIANVWYQDLRALGRIPKVMSAYEMLGLFASGMLTSPESIRRARQKLQQEHEELRGKSYGNRKAQMHKIKKQILETPEWYKGGTP